MIPIRFFLLGQPAFKRGDKPAELPAKAVALLAYLAAHRERQTRERLLGLLWAESSNDAGHKNLRNTLWAIRKALGDSVLETEEDRLGLGAAVWVDMREFQALSDADPQAAAALYRGPFADGLNVSEAPEFEIWLASERDRLAQLNLHSLCALVESHRARGEWREVITLAQQALAQDALQEPMNRALMEAQARMGERSQALHTYEVLRETLARELGVEPLPETEALRTAILQGTLIQTAAPVHRTTARKEKSRAPEERSALSPYVGRQSEWKALDEELEAARQGRPRVALLLGEVGIGKSRLWQEWSANIASKVMLLEMRGVESTNALPFAPLVQLFNTPALIKRLFTPPSPVPPVWLAEVARLLPDLRNRLPDLVLSVVPPDEERRRVLEAFTQCLLALEGQPLILFADDLHWVDRETLDWLDYLVHRLADRPFLLVGAYRPEEASSPLVRLVATWGREGLIRKITLERLTPSESAALIAALGGKPGDTERVQQHSAGNPYFLIELLRAAPSDFPPVLTDLVRARIDRLPETARQVLQAAAVLGTDSDFPLLRTTSGRNEEETLEALDILLNGSILTEREGRYEFAHPLVGTLVQRGMSGARRAFVHRRAAQALEAANAARLPQVAGQLAEHYALAGDSARAARFEVVAAERALALAAVEQAADGYRRALALEPTPERRMGLGHVLLRQGELDEARAAFETALSGFEEKGDRRGATRAALSISDTLFPSNRFDEGRDFILKALRYAEDEQDPESHALAHLAMASGQPGMGESPAETERHLRRAIEHATTNRLPKIAGQSYFRLGNVLAERGDLAPALEAFRQSIEWAQQAGNDYQEILGYNNYAYHALLLGDIKTARAQVERGLELAQSRAIRLPLQHLYSTRGEIALAEREWDVAEEWFQRALAEAEKNRNPREAANDRANLGRAAQGRGDLDNALMLLDASREKAAKLTDLHLKIKIDLWLAGLYLLRCDLAAAGESLARARGWLAGGERHALQDWADRLARSIVEAGGQVPSQGDAEGPSI